MLLDRELNDELDYLIENDTSFWTVWTPRIALLLEALLATAAIATFFLGIEGMINFASEAPYLGSDCAFVVLDTEPPAAATLAVDYTYLFYDRAASV